MAEGARAAVIHGDRNRSRGQARGSGSVGEGLAGDDAGRGGAGGELGRGGGQLGQGAAGDGEDADRADLALIDVQVAAVGTEPGDDGADAAGGGDGGAAEQGELAAGGDREAGDRAGRGVHGEQELAVVGDLHPARGHLVIGERGARDRGQGAAGVGERRDGAAVGGGVVGVGHEQLARVGGPEFTTERAETLRLERRSAGRGQAPAEADGEAVDLGGAHPGADQLGTRAVEQDVAWLGGGGQRDGGAWDAEQVPAAAEPEAGVVGSGGPGVGYVDQAAVDRDADRRGAAGGDDAAWDRAERAVAVDPQYRDLVAGGVGGEHEPAAGRELDRALGREPGAGAGAAGRERGTGFGGKRAVGMPVEGADRVRPGRVVVDVDVPGHRGSAGRGGRGGGDRHGRERRQAEYQGG